ncbi:amino acid transporter [Polyplosphaeria fusca]|uniref:Amino acid transporter n=1 Tax=Polyplosphaeria fusca TaxID=682080 RepID=A0A9P4V1B6_9PLEO|nr:amino acid transporter [Polyplosphaeria fusca]
MAKENLEFQTSALDTRGGSTLPPSEIGIPSDDIQLRRLGKRPLLKRSFGFMSILGFSCSALISWEGMMATAGGALINGGPSGVIWGFMINWIGMISTFATLSELTSMAPTAGGQYHWVAMMAPKSCRNFLSYLTGWLTTVAWQASSVMTAYLVSTIIQGMIVMTHSAYIPRPWHTVLLMWAISSLAVLINSGTGRMLARFEGFVLIIHLMGFFCILIPMVYFGSHNDPSDVFATFMNFGGWSSQGLSFLVGLPTSAAILLGADSSIHMSEEIQFAATVVPQALMWTVFINGFLALSMGISMMFCVGDLAGALEAQSTIFFSFLEILRQALKSTTAACVLSSIIVVMGVASSVGLYASASRMLWSFSRDRALPFHSHLFKLSKNALPVTAILTTLGITMLLSLIVLGSTIAFAAMVVPTAAALYSSYILVSALLLWCRTTGRFADDLDFGTHGKNRLSWGPWRIPEPWGSINNAFACIYLSFIFFWFFWPAVTPTTAETANFSILVFGSMVLFCLVWYAVKARRTFKGPVREVEE